MGFAPGIRTLVAMLNLFQSNRMTTLADAFCRRNGGPADPFDPLTVVVQSFGLGQWLKLQLSEQHGIASHVSCILPATFLWQLYQLLIPETHELTDSPYDRSRLTWRIMRLLQDNPDLSDDVRGYLSAPGDPDLRSFQLASELAMLFDEYLMYRPDWILGWQANNTGLKGHEAWQAALWRLVQDDLKENGALHRAGLHERTISALQAADALPWQRLSVFGLSTMPPLQLQTFEALGEHLEVDVYFLNPCAHYWGDILSEKDQARRSIRSLLHEDQPLTDDDYIEVGNPLLSSLGKQGREFLELLLESNLVQSDEYFVPDEEATGLGFVRNDILNLTYGGEFGSERQPSIQVLADGDSSIQVHVCHSRLREVEVLYDQILHAISRDPAIRPSDIVVMVPDIAAYAPFIQSVFTGSLPFRIADRASVTQSTLLTSFMSLMDLPALRLSGPEVMDLLEVPAVMRRFDLTQENLGTISYWIEESGIRWELNGQDKATYWNLPPEDQNSWQFGLQRLLLGFAMNPTSGDWQGVLPFEVAPGDTELLGKLCYFVDRLSHFRAAMNSEKPPGDWRELIVGMVGAFFEPRNSELLELNQLLLVVEELDRNAAAGDFKQPVSRQLIFHAIEQALSGQDSSAGFITGGITFATLVPMRSIPFRMVALLGMNDGEYPRDVRPHSFDLMAAGKPRKGDRSRKLDDRYLFLEALLSAGDLFYVSYIGKGARDNKDRPPSVVVEQWQGYLLAVFGDNRTITHSLQPFNRRYFQNDAVQSWSSTWYEALASSDEAKPFIDIPLEAGDTDTCTSVDELAAFFRHPGKYFLQQRLSVYLDTDEAGLKDTESFELDHLERFQLADGALAILMDDGDLDRFSHQVLHSGTVLPGEIGQQHLKREIARAETVRDRVIEFLDSPMTQVSTTINVGSANLSLVLDNLYGDRLVSYRAGRLRARQLVEGWVRHLAINIEKPGTTSVFIHQGEKNIAAVTRLLPVPREAATQLLHQLLRMRDEGQRLPLFLPPETALAFAESFLKESDLPRALLKARQVWELDQPGSEGKDRYWARLFSAADAINDRFTEEALAVWQPVLEVRKDG